MAKKNRINKESDEEFLKRILKIKEDTQKKVKNEMESNSAEMENYKQRGKEIGKTFEELEECEKISAEFRINPPILITKHINGISIEHKYDEKFKNKIELLKKHHFVFLSARKDTSYLTPGFKSFGKAYVKRNGSKIYLPESSIPPCINEIGMGSRILDPKNTGFILQDGDILGAENNSYININDFISNDDYHREIFVYPNSEVILNLNKQETNPAPTFIDDSKVPDVIKRNSSNTIISFNIKCFSLIHGIFKIDLRDKNKNANNILKLPAGYPEIEFLHSSKTIENIIEKTISKIPKDSPIWAKYNAKKTSKICEEITTFIELCKDNSIVVFGTMNSIKNRNNGKTTGIVLPKAATKDFILPGKITIINDRIYSDASGIVDPRVRAIIKNNMALGQYVGMMESKKEFEQKLKNFNEKQSRPKILESSASKKEKEKRKKELLEEQNYLKKSGDDEMAQAVQIQLDELELPKEEENINKEYILKMLDWYNKEIIRLKPDMNTNFPSYNSPSETDAI